jgi:hypothetical protein
MEAQQHLTI